MIISTRQPKGQIIFPAMFRPSHELVTELDNYYLQYFRAFGNHGFIGVHYSERRILPVRIFARQRNDLVDISIATRFAILALTSYRKSSGLAIEDTTKYLSKCYEAMQRSISDGPSIELVYSSYTVCILSAMMQDRNSLLVHIRGFCETIKSLKSSRRTIQKWEWNWMEVLQLNLLISTCSQALEVNGVTYALAHESILELWQEPRGYGLGVEEGELVLGKVLLHIAFHLQYYLVLLNSSSKNVQLSQFNFKESGTAIQKVMRKLTSLLSLLGEALSRVDDKFLMGFQRWHQFLCQGTTEGPTSMGITSLFLRQFPNHQVRTSILWNFYIFRKEFPFALEEYAIQTLYQASVPTVEQLERCEPHGIEVWLVLQDSEFSSSQHIKGLCTHIV